MSSITKHFLPEVQGGSQTGQLERSGGSPASTPGYSDIHVSTPPPLFLSSPSKAGASERLAWKPSLSHRRHSLSEPSPPQQNALSEQTGLRQSPALLTGPERLPLSPLTALATSKVWFTQELSDVEPLAIDFLQRFVHLIIIVPLHALLTSYISSRYIRSFDTSSQKLPQAYSSTCLFSHRFLQSSSSRTDPLTACGDSEIRQALASLASFKFCPKRPNYATQRPRVHYDVVSLGPEAGGGILLTVYGEIVHFPVGVTMVLDQGESGKVFFVHQSFVLQIPEKEDGDGTDSG